MRAERSEATRESILDAALAFLREGERAFTYKGLARSAGVSAPTVYRHFPERRDLFEALYLRIEGIPAEESGSGQGPLDADSLRLFFARFDDADSLARREARLSTAWEFSRAATVPRRREAFRRLVEARVPHLAEPERTWLIDLGVILVSSATAESFRLYLDRSGAETADRVAFALDALLAHAATLTPEESR